MVYNENRLCFRALRAHKKHDQIPISRINHVSTADFLPGFHPSFS
jgi:hypothetical protein